MQWVTSTADPTRGEALWRPAPAAVAGSRLTRYRKWLGRPPRSEPADYDALWRWSVEEPEVFWRSIADFFAMRFAAPPRRILSGREMPGARWFEGARLNYAEHALTAAGEGPALVYRSEDGARRELSRAELRAEVGRVRAGLAALGVGKGDRVVAFLPNCPEAVIAFLATASLGAVWSSCPPEFGVDGVLDRLRQIEPKVLFAVDGSPYGGRFHDRGGELTAIVAGLPSLEQTILVPRADTPPAIEWRPFAELGAGLAETDLAFTQVEFEHPLWVLYSSGTTGLPKAIVQGHGGILLEHYKQIGLHTDLGAGDRFFWFTTTGWMMWNYLVGGLLAGSTIVLYEGSPGHPDLTVLYRLAEEEGVTYFGVSAPFLMACRKAGLQPGAEVDLSALRGIGSTGAPLPPEGFDWVYEAVKPDVWLGSLLGGTDVCTGFLGPCPWLPVRRGEIQCRSLGAKAEAWNEKGEPVIGEVGELVLSVPMPSMPVCFWNDEDGERYRSSYFDVFPGVWRHGDWVMFHSDGASIPLGRSDSTLNRGGVRMGTSEFYRVVETLPEIKDSVVVDTGSLGREGCLWLFVALAGAARLDPELEQRIRATLRRRLSPRHVPDEIRAVSGVPRTLSGKKLEVPIKRILTGTAPEEAVNPGTLANPESIAELLAVAAEETA